MVYKVSLWAFVAFLIVMQDGSTKHYQKEFYDNGKIRSEGWLANNTKIGYWKFYYSNGEISEEGSYISNKRERYWFFYDANRVLAREGHYRNGTMNGWWLFYDAQGRIRHKCQLREGKKNGYCLKYNEEKLASAEKYKNGKKIKEWYSFASFKQENRLSDLR
ncbi:MAG: toxin-antitoxin system YwqK family antitoxin [Aurantibacter sp.]